MINYESPNVQTDALTRDYFEFLSDLYLDGNDSMAMGRYDHEISLYEEIGSYVVRDIFQINSGTQ